MTPDWRPLDDELLAWSTAGLSLPLWWRDDDAVAVSQQLKTLADASQRLGLAVHLAIIPRDVDPDLVQYVAQHQTLIPVVHGWAHQNYAPAHEKKAEFRLHRPLDLIVNDAEAGFSKLAALFGDMLRPVFVPPWNRIAQEVSARLPTIGYRIMSTSTPRDVAMAAPGLEQINTHLDPIDWRGTRGLADPDALITQTAALLRDRRYGRTDNSEPFGVLTHHLVHDRQIWAFTEALLQKLLEGPAIAWTAPKSNERSVL
ncbi:MAG: polysaccharide deacetylase family protein [Pseudomonadota bacterium]